MAAGGSSSSAQPEKLMKGLQLDKKSSTSSQEVGNGRMEIDMRNEASVLNFTCIRYMLTHTYFHLPFDSIMHSTSKYKDASGHGLVCYKG